MNDLEVDRVMRRRDVEAGTRPKRAVLCVDRKCDRECPDWRVVRLLCW